MSDPAAVPDLMLGLRLAECIAERVGADTCRVSYPGADEAEARVALAFFLKAWQGRHPVAEATLLPREDHT